MRFPFGQRCDPCRGAAWPSILHELDARERAWNARTVRYPREDCVPWLPFPRRLFMGLLADAVEAAPARVTDGHFGAPRFLDVGAGIGTKMELAARLFSLQTSGIEIVPELAAEARARGLSVTLADAFTYDGFDQAEIVYLNRPSTQMEALEQRVMDGMAPGAVLMLVNGLGLPELDSWTLVSKEWGTPVQGAWIKP